LLHTPQPAGAVLRLEILRLLVLEPKIDRNSVSVCDPAPDFFGIFVGQVSLRLPILIATAIRSDYTLLSTSGSRGPRANATSKARVTSARLVPSHFTT
jgi:hypothetical protein